MALSLCAAPAATWAQDLESGTSTSGADVNPAPASTQAGDIFEEAPGTTPQASQWMWGVVESVDFAGNAFTVRYLVYDTAEEATKAIQVNDKTVFHGVMGLADLEAGMHVSIEYREIDGSGLADVVDAEPVN
ncbi:MAG: hypothetical protein ACM3L6_06335 [Deltaproteobacteria bacterium]